MQSLPICHGELAKRAARRDIQAGDEGKVDVGANKVSVDVPDNYERLGNLVSATIHNQACIDDYDHLERAVLEEDILLTPRLLSAYNMERLWMRFSRSQLDETHRSFLRIISATLLSMVDLQTSKFFILINIAATLSGRSVTRYLSSLL